MPFLQQIGLEVAWNNAILSQAVSIGDEKVSLFPFFPVCPSVRREEAIHREISTFSLFPFSLFPVGTCYTQLSDPMTLTIDKNSKLNLVKFQYKVARSIEFNLFDMVG